MYLLISLIFIDSLMGISNAKESHKAPIPTHRTTVIPSEIRFLPLIRTVPGLYHYLPDYKYGTDGVLEGSDRVYIYNYMRSVSFSSLPSHVRNLNHLFKRDHTVFGISYDGENTLHLLDIYNGTIYHSFHVKNHSPVEITYDVTPDFDQIVVVSEGGWAKIYDLYSGNLLYSYKNDNTIESVAISKDGDFILIGDWWDTAKLIDVKKDQVVKVFSVPGYGASVRFSPDAQYGLAIYIGQFSKTESDEGTIYVWDLNNRTLIHTLFQWDETLNYAEFSPDSRYIISLGSRLNTITVWNVATGEPVARSNLRGRSSYDINFSPDGTEFVTLDEGHRSQIWDFSSFAPSDVDDYSLYR